MARDPVLCEKALLVDTGGSFFLVLKCQAYFSARGRFLWSFRARWDGYMGDWVWFVSSHVLRRNGRWASRLYSPKKKTSVVSSARVYGGTSVKNREAFESVFLCRPPPTPPPSDTLGGVVNRGNVRKAHKQTNRIKMIFLRSLVP